jgi:hypothetical protein
MVSVDLSSIIYYAFNQKQSSTIRKITILHVLERGHINS